MKNFKKFTAFVLALCMMFSLSISAFAAEEHDHHEHTVYESAPDEEIAVQSAEAVTNGTIPGSRKIISKNYCKMEQTVVYYHCKYRSKSERGAHRSSLSY